MGIRFGQHLRTQRLARGLTLDELGEGAFPASYISLIEAGRREPGPAVVRELARRLQDPPRGLQGGSGQTAAGDGAYLASALAARQAWDLREYEHAAGHAETAAAAAQTAGKASSWWDMACLRAECLVKLRKFEDCVVLVRRLLSHPLSESPALASRAHEMLSLSFTGLGRTAAALEHAHEAVRLAAEMPGRSEVLFGALRRLIRALADSGRLDEAWERCRSLSDLMAETETAPVSTGESEWTIGNVAFIRGDHTEGAERHRRAARFLSSANDLELWSRFNQEIASTRLAGGNLDQDTLDALKRAEMGFSVIGCPRADQLELALLRARWLCATGSPAESIPLLREVHQGRGLLRPHVAAEAAKLLGQALRKCELTDETSASGEEAQGEPVVSAPADALPVSSFEASLG
ncbi:helix-turn-helix domain-containing protein [Sinomonas susongensis]|uniref:helix-turn-helix domain-containing protein n=1 Tax=Sinomonas susongensis TaxID=1324851 RepID=UPI0011099577|nr:helix-turn-helix transcriptional regulator [Sinomonas susongensis]